MKDNSQSNNVNKLNKENCCGCGICMHICPTGAISMCSDKEGFIYPVVEAELCINCGKCINQCTTVSNKGSHPSNLEEAYYAYNKNEDELRAAASGGVAGALYYAFIENNGYVTGVRYTNDYKSVAFELTDNKEDINKFKGSKYVKADLSQLYPEIKEKLDLLHPVLVIALPCEIAAVKKYLGKEYENLYTCDLICHGPTSVKVLEKCVGELEEKYKSKIVEFSCRGKKPYWKPFYLCAKMENGEEYSRVFAESSFGKAFQIMKRPSCNVCDFKAPFTYADMTIGDFHGAKKDTPEYNRYGTSVCFLHTDKGRELFAMLKDFEIGEANINRARGNRALFQPVKKVFGRKSFVKELNRSGLEKAASLPQVKAGLKLQKVKKRLTAIKKRLKKYS